MEMLMSAIQDKASPDTENIINLNLVAVTGTTVQVLRLLLQCKLQMTGYDLLY
jgi:hypothetical protein